MSTGATVPAPVPAAPQESPSALMRILQTIYAPAQAFRGLNGKTGWIIPWLVLSVISYCFVFAIDKKVGFDKVTENQIKMSPKAAERMDSLSPEQRQKQVDISTKVTKYVSFAAPIFLLIWTVIIAAVLLGTFNFGCGAQVGFGMCLSVVMLSWIPGTVRTLLAIVALFAGVDPDGFDIRNPLATNLGSFFDPSAHAFLYKLGSGLDIFMIWTLIVAAIGFSCVSKIKRSTAMAVIFGWYAVFIVVGAAFGALFS